MSGLKTRGKYSGFQFSWFKKMTIPRQNLSLWVLWAGLRIGLVPSGWRDILNYLQVQCWTGSCPNYIQTIYIHLYKEINTFTKQLPFFTNFPIAFPKRLFSKSLFLKCLFPKCLFLNYVYFSNVHFPYVYFKNVYFEDV